MTGLTCPGTLAPTQFESYGLGFMVQGLEFRV